MSDKQTSTFDRWASERWEDGERLVAFESWVAEQLAERLRWPTDPKRKLRQVLQCRAFIVGAVADMGDHGYLFQPRQIASMIIEKLDEIRARQEAGQIRELYPYLRRVWQSYTGAQAEELKDRSMRTGTHISQIMDSLTTIPGMVAEVRRESLLEKKRRALKAARNTDS